MRTIFDVKPLYKQVFLNVFHKNAYRILASLHNNKLAETLSSEKAITYRIKNVSLRSYRCILIKTFEITLTKLLRRKPQRCR